MSHKTPAGKHPHFPFARHCEATTSPWQYPPAPLPAAAKVNPDKSGTAAKIVARAAATPTSWVFI